MATPEKLTDAALQDYLDKGLTQTHIAALYRISPAAVSKRVKAMDKRAAAKARPAVAQAAQSLWDTRAAADENYNHALKLRDDPDADPVQSCALVLKHIEFGLKALATAYTVEETKAFMEDVLAVLDEADETLRVKVLTRLQQRRPTRAAFLPGE